MPDEGKHVEGKHFSHVLDEEERMKAQIKGMAKERFAMIKLIKETVLEVDGIKTSLGSTIEFVRDLYVQIIQEGKYTPALQVLDTRLDNAECTIREWFDSGYDESKIEQRLEAASEKGESYAISAMVRLSGYPSGELNNTIAAKGGILPRLASLEQKANSLRLRTNELRELGIMIDDIRHRDLFTKELGEVKERMIWLESKLNVHIVEDKKPKRRRWKFW